MGETKQVHVRFATLRYEKKALAEKGRKSVLERTVGTLSMNVP